MGSHHIDVRSDNKAENTNTEHGVNYSKVAKHRLTTEGRDDVAYDPKSGDNQDVYFRVPEESEEVLEQDGVTTTCRVIEARVEVTVSQ